MTISWSSTFEPGDASGIWFAVDASLGGQHVTDQRSVTVELPPGDHVVMVRLVDRAGGRVGNAGWNTRFTVERP